MKINNDKALVENIKKQLQNNEILYGKRYCPCVSSYKYSELNNEDYICPCKDFRENTPIGEECHCGLFIK